MELPDMEQPNTATSHVLDQCRCIIDPGCLKLVQRQAYEQAIGAKVDTVVLAMNNRALESLALVHDWLARLHWAREKQKL